MRVCILTKGEPYGWTRHHVQGFRRRRGEVLTIGPNITRDVLNRYNLGYLYDSFTPTDIETELRPDVVLVNLLPPRSEPDLIVAISTGGISLCPVFEKTRCPKVCLSVDTWQSPRDYLDTEHMRQWLFKRSFLFVRATVVVQGDTQAVVSCVIVARKRRELWTKWSTKPSPICPGTAKPSTSR